MRRFFGRWTRKEERNSGRRRLRSQRGQTMSEYALVVAAIAMVAFGAYRSMGTDVQSVVTRVDSQI